MLGHGTLDNGSFARCTSESMRTLEIYAVAAFFAAHAPRISMAVEVPGNIWLDYHHYQCMGDEAGSVPEHCQAGCSRIQVLRTLDIPHRCAYNGCVTRMRQAMEFEGMLTENMQSLPVQLVWKYSFMATHFSTAG